MCMSLYISAKTDDGKPYPGAPEPIEFDTSRGVCLCGIDVDDDFGRSQRADLAEALRPFLHAVSFGDIVIEVR